MHEPSLMLDPELCLTLRKCEAVWKKNKSLSGRKGDIFFVNISVTEILWSIRFTETASPPRLYTILNLSLRDTIRLIKTQLLIPRISFSRLLFNPLPICRASRALSALFQEMRKSQ